MNPIIYLVLYGVTAIFLFKKIEKICNFFYFSRNWFLGKVLISSFFSLGLIASVLALNIKHYPVPPYTIKGILRIFTEELATYLFFVYWLIAIFLCKRIQKIKHIYKFSTSYYSVTFIGHLFTLFFLNKTVFEYFCVLYLNILGFEFGYNPNSIPRLLLLIPVGLNVAILYITKITIIFYFCHRKGLTAFFYPMLLLRYGKEKAIDIVSQIEEGKPLKEIFMS